MLSGWLEDEPARVTDRMEIRPAAEMGPIILCLDTSGSMQVRNCGAPCFFSGHMMEFDAVHLLPTALSHVIHYACTSHMLSVTAHTLSSLILILIQSCPSALLNT
jgi:hypothetical protein